MNGRCVFQMLCGITRGGNLQKSLGNSFKVNNPLICFGGVIIFCILAARSNEISSLNSCNLLGSSTFESCFVKSTTGEGFDSGFDSSQNEIFVENVGTS